MRPRKSVSLSKKKKIKLSNPSYFVRRESFSIRHVFERKNRSHAGPLKIYDRFKNINV